MNARGPRRQLLAWAFLISAYVVEVVMWACLTIAAAALVNR